MANGNKVLTRSNSKTMIRHGELVRILNAAEIQQWHDIIAKVEAFQEQELTRKSVRKQMKVGKNR